MTDKQRPTKGSHEAKDARQDHAKGHQHSQHDTATHNRGDSHRRRKEDLAPGDNPR
jgi:hypothetical protein